MDGLGFSKVRAAVGRSLLSSGGSAGSTLAPESCPESEQRLGIIAFLLCAFLGFGSHYFYLGAWRGRCGGGGRRLTFRWCAPQG